MSEFARVESVDALRDFRRALCKFAETVNVGLVEAESEVQRTTLWLTHDQQRYWKNEVRKRTELMHRAKLALAERRNQQTPLGGRYSCVDEVKALAQAERRLEEAQEKLNNVRRWTRELEKEAMNYRALTQGVNHLIDAEVPNALAALDNMTGALEAYATTAPPSDAQEADAAQEGAAASGTASVARQQPGAEDPIVLLCRQLRARTLAADERAEVTAGAIPVSQSRATSIRQDESEAVVRLAGSTPARPAGTDKIVVDTRAWFAERVYLEHGEPSAPADSGWYVGVVDDPSPAMYQSVSFEAFLQVRPEWAGLLSLPVGWLVVLGGDSVEAVADQTEEIVWRGARLRDGSAHALSDASDAPPDER